MNAQRMDPKDLIEGVKAISGKEIAGLLKDAKSTMIF
jgi:predicted peroxiredoxin